MKINLGEFENFILNLESQSKPNYPPIKSLLRMQEVKNKKMLKFKSFEGSIQVLHQLV